MTMTYEEALRNLTPADIDHAKQLRRLDAAGWQSKWVSELPHVVDNAADIAGVLDATWTADEQATDVANAKQASDKAAKYAAEWAAAKARQQ